MKIKKIKAILFGFLLLAGCGTSSQSRVYTIGIDPNWYSLEIPGRESSVSGFSSELLQEIARIKKLQIATLRVNWDTLIEGLQKGKYEGILSSMQPHVFNQTQYDFSDLYILTGPVLVMPQKSSVDSLDMLDGKEVGIIRGSSAVSQLEKNPKIIIRTYDSEAQMLDDIVSQTIDGAILDFLNAEAYCQDLYQGKLKIATPPMTTDGIRLITLHDKAPALIEEFNAGLKKLKKSGKYNALCKKWSLPQE